MNSNHHFEIGAAHQVCHDYAISGVSKLGFPFAIVCDGCSGSPHTDIGSRILAHLTASIVKYNANINIHSIERRIIEKIDEFNSNTCSCFEIDRRYLDSTVLIAWLDQKNLNVYARGDGVFIVNTKTYDGLVAHKIEYPSGLPNYLNYDIIGHEKRKELLGDRGNGIVTVTALNPTKDPMIMITQNISNSWSGEFDPETINWIALATDGAFSFVKKINSGTSKIEEPVPFESIVHQLTGFKNLHGEFVHRRMQKLSKELAAEGIVHNDDLAVAALVV